MGLKISSDVKYKSSDKPKDIVLLSSPLPGTSVSSDSSVQLVLSSGEKREKSISIDIDLPESDFDQDTNSTLTVYVDGVLDESKTTTLDTSYITRKTFTFKGSQGIKNIRIKLNDELYKVFELDFDNMAYRIIQ